MSNLKHTYDIQVKINERKRRFNLKDENIIIVDYCLGCQKKFKVYRNEIQNISSINVYVDDVTGEKYLYCLCANCIKTFITPYNKKAFTELNNNICKEIAKLQSEILSK